MFYINITVLLDKIQYKRSDLPTDDSKIPRLRIQSRSTLGSRGTSLFLSEFSLRQHIAFFELYIPSIPRIPVFWAKVTIMNANGM